MRQVRIRLETADLSRLRWAISPAWELLASLRVLGRPGWHAIHMPWLAKHRDDPLLTEPRHQLVRDLAIHAPGHLPGFLAPTPESPLADIDAELQAVAASPDAVVRRDLAGIRPAGRPASFDRFVDDPQAHLPGLVRELREYWCRAIEPTWPLMRTLLERDIHHRVTTLADHGPGEMLNDLHHDIRWEPDERTLVLDNRLADVADPDRALQGRGLVLVPSVFAWPRAYAKTAEPWTPVVRYPARGVGVLWEQPAATADLSAALGRTRARLLELLETPSTTDQLARMMRLAPGGISAQLHRLVVADLAFKTRVGREVYYARTVRGDGLTS